MEDNKLIISKCKELKSKYCLTSVDVFYLIEDNHNHLSQKTVDRFFQDNCNIKPSAKTIRIIYDSLVKYNNKGSGLISSEDLIIKLREDIEYYKEENRRLLTIIELMSRKK